MCAKKKHADLLRGQMVMKITWNISINLIPYIFLNAIFIVYDALFLGHLSHSGDLLLWVASVVMRRLSSVNIFFSRITEPILTKFGM